MYMLVRWFISNNRGGSIITSSASGANGVFCYGGNGGRNGASGDGTTLVIRDVTIVTTGSGSGGIMTTGGGTTYAYNLDAREYASSRSRRLLSLSKACQKAR